jgi:hypothetical protein
MPVFSPSPLGTLSTQKYMTEHNRIYLHTHNEKIMWQGSADKRFWCVVLLVTLVIFVTLVTIHQHTSIFVTIGHFGLTGHIGHYC